ncbi:MAG: peptidylprolyl isomerase, partial [Candidatus Auribacterota bacterium]|nr:peptidylprolyl isomerase [Candidatus Auribacterota bacterium]
FQIQTRVEIEYITINRARFKDSVRVSPEEIEARYQESIAAFSNETGEEPSRDEMKDEIRVELTDEKCEAEAGALARKINTSFVEDTYLSTPAKEFSLPMKKSGYFTMDEAIPGLGENPEINRMAFTMELDEIVSYPVPIKDGFLFFKVTGKEDAHLRPFEEAKSEVLNLLNEELTAEETLKVARDELTELRELMAEEEFDFESAAEKLDLTIESTPLFSREGNDSLPPSPSFIQAAFLTPPEQVSNLIPIEAGYAFLTVIKRVPADPMPEEEEEKWEILTRRGKARLVYDSWFNNLIQESKFSITNKELAP